MNLTIHWLSECCQQHLLHEKWLLADELRIANQWKDQLSLAGHSSINLHSKTLRSLTLSLVGDQLNLRQLSFANHATSRLIVHDIVAGLIDDRQLEYFDNLHSVESVCDLIAKSIRDLRLAGITPEMFANTKLESDAKANDLRLIFDAYCNRLNQGRFADYSDCLMIALEGIHNQQIVLSEGLLVLIPEELNLSHLEKNLLNAIQSRTKSPPRSLHASTDEDASIRVTERFVAGELRLKYFSGLGEVNEVRGVLQRCLSNRAENAIPFDQVELLHTDHRQYVPLILEVLVGCVTGDDVSNDKRTSIDQLPVTFADGIACIYARPGRALRSWLRWIKMDYVQTKAVQMLREGILFRPKDADEIGYGRLASTLRSVHIAFQAPRYLIKINEAIENAKRCLAEHAKGVREPNPHSEDLSTRDFGLPALNAVFAMMKPLINLAPNHTDDPVKVLAKARVFLLNCARAESKLDKYAREQLVEEINGMMLTLQATPNSDFDVLQWLEELPTESKILASGPMPGCIHVASLDRGGYSGRKNIFVVGLDDRPVG